MVAVGAGAASTVNFERDVFPVLQRTCFECHGAEQNEGGLRLDVREGAFNGGENGATRAASFGCE